MSRARPPKPRGPQTELEFSAACSAARRLEVEDVVAWWNSGTATYTLLLPGDTLEGLDLDHPVTLDGETLPLGLILAPQLRYDHASLARALWAVDSFPGLQGFLGALRVLLRFSRAEPGAPLTACVLPVTR